MRPDEIASFEALARELTSNLDPERKGALVDLDPETRRAHFRRLYDLALEQLERLDLPEAAREEARSELLLLAEATLERQGLFLPAAALYLLAHDEKCSEDSAPARFEQAVLRFKLAWSLLQADEDNVDNIRRCAEIVRWTIPQADALWRQTGIPRETFFELQYRMHSWLGGRYKDLDSVHAAAEHYCQASLAARTARDRISATLGLAGCYERLGDPQRANEILMLHDDEIGEVEDEELLEVWTLVRNGLRFHLGGNPPSQESWSKAPGWRFLQELISPFLDFDRQPGPERLESAITALEELLTRIPAEEVTSRFKVLTQLVYLAYAQPDLPKARKTLQQARLLESRIEDEAAKLRLRALAAAMRRDEGDVEGACSEYRSLLPAARNLLGDEEGLGLLGHFLEALAQRIDPPDAEEIRIFSREALTLFERQLQRQPGARARRRLRELHQRAFEGVVAALVSTAERLSTESDTAQELLSEAWRVILTIRNPELSRLATDPEPVTAAHVRELEDDFHRLVRDDFVEGTGKGSWTAALERLVEREITILRTDIAESAGSFQPPAEGRALAYFQFREMLSTHPVLVLGCRDGRIDPGLLPGSVRRGSAGSMRELLPPSLAWLVLPEGPWFAFLDGDLHHHRIESLPERTGDSRWFGEDRGIQNCLRSSVHPAARRPVDLSRGWLGLGDVPGQGRLSDLSGTRQEIGQIRTCLEQRGYPAESLLREQANAVRLRERLAALRPSVLHIAAHGCFDSDHPDACCLFLAESPGVPEREMLPFRRVRELDLEGVDLVVLSACRSSKGRSSRAAGYEGLAWAFLRAGAAQVVASRYEVKDRVTADLMSVFYRHLQDLPAPEALGRTRTECLANGMEASEVSAWSIFS